MSEKIDKEILLTKEEIENINCLVNNNPILKHPNAISFGSDKTSVYKVTPINGIIIIKGDNHTGFEHIDNRHNYWRNEPNWIDGKLDNPSKFSKKSLPIVDYSNISDMLYSENNLNLEKNKKTELFDLYIGEVDDEVNGKMKYRMVLYKDTKILHTLFPESKDNNRLKKNIINYHKGNTIATYKENKYIIETPWLNETSQIIYNLVVFIDLIEKTEICILMNLKEQLQMKLFKYDKETISTLNDEMNYISFSDFTPIERKIKEFEQKIINNEIK
jgi:hypothetical protein